LCRAQNPILWGKPSYGGANHKGTIFSYNTSTGKDTDLHNFGSSADGQVPYGSLIRASNGLLYGMTVLGGVNPGGTIFSYNISTGAEIVLHDFYSFPDDGFNPYGSLLQAKDNLLYGMTSLGGSAANSSGTIFSYNISTGIETVLHNFGSDTDGQNPYGSLIQTNDSLLYGLTPFGGVNKGVNGVYGDGTLFSYNIFTGVESVLHYFGSDTDGQNPYGSLLQVNDSLLYGTTAWGGTNDEGTIFSYNITTGTEFVLHSFGGTNGLRPLGALILADNGLLYGMTALGGSYDSGTIFSYNITTSAETDLHDFAGGDTDGKYAYSSLIQASNRVLYGMTCYGGANDSGIIFSYNISTGKETDLHNFTGADGACPFGDLLEIDSPFTGINQLAANSNQLSIYPNPTSGQFTIKTMGNQNGYLVEIYNLLGEEIYQSVNKSPSGDLGIIDLNTQPAGMYFVSLKSDEGIEVKKVVVTR